jgi:hypothetical protein
MGVPAPEMDSVEELSTEGLLGSLRTISAPERRKHASVYNYWLSIRRGRQFPPIRDLDPLEISDAGPFSLLLEMIGGGEDAEVRHIGQAIKGGVQVQKVHEAPNPSLLSCISTRLPVVAGCRDAFAFEDEFETKDGKTRCWVTLLPFSATGTWIDYVYGFVSLDDGSAGAEASEEAIDDAEAQPQLEAAHEDTSEHSEDIAEEALGSAWPEVEPPEVAEPEEFEPPFETAEELAEPDETVSPPSAIDESAEAPEEPLEEVFATDELIEGEGIEDEAAAPPHRSGKIGFSTKFFETLGFYGKPTEVELDPATASVESWEAEVMPLSAEPSAEPEEISQLESSPLDEPILDEPIAELEAASDEVKEPIPESEPVSSSEANPTAEGSLDSKLTDVRAKADEARQAKLRANVALYEGLSAAYDFALDAEGSPEEYLRLLEAEGLKIQLRSPMKPVVKLAFNGMCDDATIHQLEAVLSWAFNEDLPRGTLADRIESEGGIGPILNGLARTA